MSHDGVTIAGPICLSCPYQNRDLAQCPTATTLGWTSSLLVPVSQYGLFTGLLMSLSSAVEASEGWGFSRLSARVEKTLHVRVHRVWPPLAGQLRHLPPGCHQPQPLASGDGHRRLVQYQRVLRQLSNIRHGRHNIPHQNLVSSNPGQLLHSGLDHSFLYKLVGLLFNWQGGHLYTLPSNLHKKTYLVKSKFYLTNFVHQKLLLAVGTRTVE